MRRCAPLLVAGLALAGCQGGVHTERWELPDGTAIELDLGEPAHREAADGRVRWRLDSGLTVTIQDLAGDERSPQGRRTARAVADALVERMELGERDGELSTYGCRAGGADAECVSGWMAHREQRFARRGAVLEAGARIVWIDVSAPIGRREEVERRSREILRSLRIDVGSARPS